MSVSQNEIHIHFNDEIWSILVAKDNVSDS